MKVLSEEKDFTEIIEGFNIYRKSTNDWIDSNESEVKEEYLVKSLEFTLRKEVHWRRRNALEAFFPLSQFKAVVLTQSLSPTKKTTRDKIQQVLKETVKVANNEFNAAYDGATGLLNSRSLEEAIIKLAGVVPPLFESANVEIKPVGQMTLMSLDIDYFKQVNDSYGHDYGDVVIKCFANRLEGIVSSYKKEFGSAITIEIGRSGGEEFGIALHGDVNVDRVKLIADRIRTAICDNELPTEAEWAQLCMQNGRCPIILPHVSERRITTSIGIASLKRPSIENALAAFADLRRESDAALYRAKAGGRNAIRYFPEIRDRFGTVIEHHQETNIVTIDIGSQVNVKKGQEFHVYHPDFTGGKAFIFSDGRSKKRLGNYPRFSSGRIVVFDVQPEISFCTVADKSLERFPSGSALEQIPLGSIYHLVSAEAKASFDGAVKAAELDTYMNSVVTRNARPVAAVFSLLDLPIVEKERGTAFVNRALASLFDEVQKSFPLPAKICQIDSDKIAVAAQIEPKANCEALIKKIIDSAAKKMSNLVELSAGVYSTNLKLEKLNGDQSKFDGKKSLSYARYAALALMGSTKNIEFFTAETAFQIISHHRDRSTFSEGLVDAQVLRNLGVDYSRFENVTGLCAFQIGKYDIALAHFQKAISLEPAAPVFQANLGIAQFWLNQLLQAHETFSRIHIENPDLKLNDAYTCAEALAAYAAFKDQPISVNHIALKSMLQNTLQLESWTEIYGREKIEAALAEISLFQPPPAPPLRPDEKSEAETNLIWTKLVEAVGRVSPFTRSYLVDGHPVSFADGIFIIGFPVEFEDHLSLVDNKRNQVLITTKLNELGHKAKEIKFIKHEYPAK
ncbi:MAG TPA: diguanylate cyclase [Verrucomicrobiae bacterium]|nr:diguanylate cyclase [Verrucomicrobiae bacterium]